MAERSHELAEALTRLHMAREATLDPGAVVDGRYRIRRMLGRGGMGQVYACERVADGAPFALKVVRGEATPDKLARFAREAEIAARLEDPGLIAVHDVGVTREGMLFLIMDLTDGSSLEKARARFGDVRWGLRILKEVAQGLAALHEKGVVHRDLKPANVLLGDHGARIADFGIARLLGRETLGYNVTSEALAPLTRTGVIVGTPHYMAPELMEGGSRDPEPSSDLFSFGVLAYEILAGHRPRDTKPLHEAAPTVPVQVAAMIDRARATDPAARPTAAELARTLAASLSTV